MPLLPFDTFYFETSLTQSEIAARLAAAVEPRKFFRLGGGRSPFEGKVSAESFDITRILGYQNSFVPRIRGTMTSTSGGSLVKGTMRLHPLVLGFDIVWFSMVFFTAVGMWSGMLAAGEWESKALVPVGMFVFGWALNAGAFTFEARRATGLLAELLSPVTPPARSSVRTE